MKNFFSLFLILFIFLGLFSPALAQEELLEQKNKTNLYFFYGSTCPHCKKAEAFLDKLKIEYPELEVISYEVFGNKENADLFLNLLEACNKEKKVRVPAIFIGDEVIIGYFDDEITGSKIEKAVQECIGNKCSDPFDKIDECRICECQGEKEELCQCQECSCPTGQKEDEIISYPFIGKINLSKLSLPVLTVAVAALDGFNPCAMWILLFMIALLINVQSRKRIWLVAGAFIFASGVVYYLLLSAWLNLFLAISYVTLTRIIIGLAALFFGLWQIKRFIAYKPGVCEVVSEDSKIRTKLRNHTEKAVNNPILIFSILGVIVLALAVNLIEFFCSAGLPAIYTRVLSLNNLGRLSYYLYLLLYTFIFMLDDIIVFVIAVFALNKIGFTDKYNKWSMLIGGILILILGLLLIFKPDFLAFG